MLNDIEILLAPLWYAAEKSRENQEQALEYWHKMAPSKENTDGN